MSSAICFNLDQSKILSSGNGLKSMTHSLVGSDGYLSSHVKHSNVDYIRCAKQVDIEIC